MSDFNKFHRISEVHNLYKNVPADILDLRGDVEILSITACRCLKGHIFLTLKDFHGKKISVRVCRSDQTLALNNLVLKSKSPEETALYGIFIRAFEGKYKNHFYICEIVKILDERYIR